MPTIGNEGLPGFSPDSDEVFGGGSTGLADFRFLVTFSAQWRGPRSEGSHVEPSVQTVLESKEL
jgi:hypothetical protein